jgi:hypothetical protein
MEPFSGSFDEESFKEDFFRNIHMSKEVDW